ncbi:SNF2 family N-terminal domain-domain-containing protein [Coniella lustricola]|uniref:DNA helicase n=1 Tax=Coniella lustricola TaxID=2025994 RepID=A0A2T3A1S6_9PEZI|nr:SNF2 family N-terminal domain-domain-containing protein [Coniella lustricola]
MTEPASTASAAPNESPRSSPKARAAARSGPANDARPSRSPRGLPRLDTHNLQPSRDAGHDPKSASSSPLSDVSGLSALSTTPDLPSDDEGSLLFPVNGRVNGRVNGAAAASNGRVHASASLEDDRPAKRRRVGESTPPPPSSKMRKPLESPPWKKFTADGPTTIMEDGKRKSGRLQTTVLPMTQPSNDKRSRRKSHAQTSPAAKNRHHGSRGGQAAGTLAAKKTAISSKSSTSRTITASKQPARKSAASDTKTTSSRNQRFAQPTQPSRTSARTRRPSRNARDGFDDNLQNPQSTRNASRIRLRTGRADHPPLTELPLLHPQRVLQKKLASNLEEYFKIADTIPVAEGGQYLSDDEPLLSEEAAAAEARIILRIEHEARPDGLLGENCSIYQPEPAEEVHQYAHVDYVVKAAQNLRKWMIREQKDHREKAKRLAEACQAAWKARQPKTTEEIEREETELWLARYRVVVKAMFGTWDNVRTVVNRRRVEEWEAEEQRRVKAALQEAVSRSEQQLLARQAQFDSDITDEEHTDEEGDSDLDSDLEDGQSQDGMDIDSRIASGSDVDEDNMSSSEEDDDRKSVASDEGLTQEQLRAKYADLPSIENVENEKDTNKTSPAKTNGVVAEDETSDESVDMDDDMGSSDDESGGEGSSEEDGESEDERDRPSGLLGLFFGKKELKELGEDKAAELVEEDLVDNDDGDDDDDDDDDVMLLDMEPSEAATPAAEETTQPEGKTNGTTSLEEPTTKDTGPKKHVNGESEAIRSVNQASLEKNLPALDTAMNAESTAPPTSPEAEAPTTNPASPDRSQSPHTTDTKPSDIDTATSVEPPSAVQDVSRSVSEQPGAPRTEVPFLLRGTLREYQHYGLDWLAGLYANNTNGILADEMGLGKTIQTIALLAHLACVHEVWGPHLVIVPTSVMLNWEMEFKKWCPGFKILTYYGTQEERKRKRQGWTNDDVWNVCITSYQIVLQDNQVFRRRRWHYMILDEAHNIKNFRSQRWQTLLGFNTHSRLLLTGTPLQNNLTELWSLLFFLMPSENGVGGFADLKEFHDWFARPESQILEHGREQMDDEARAIISKLHKVLRPYLLRRLKADVEKQMPAKIEHVEFCRLSKRQRELYDGFLARSETRETLSSGNYLSIINCLMQLRKVCNHPDLFVDRPIMTSFRMDKSVPAGYDITARLVQRKLLAEDPMTKVNLGVLNLMPALNEHISRPHAERIHQLSAHSILLNLRDIQRERAQSAYQALDPTTVNSNIAFLDTRSRWHRFEELQHYRYLNALGREQWPVYGKQLRDFLTLETDKRPYKARPRVPKQVMSWFEEDSFVLRTMIPTLDQRAESLEMTITKFACVTPAVVTRDLDSVVLGIAGENAFTDADLKLSAPVRRLPFIPPEPPVDPWHEARMRLSIQFPDKRLLQYDCGKLQALDKLLRKLQAGGHRALIFTQMTKVLDILEQFLNIHGHKYLRLDGATKVEQRQILTDRFNVDNRILCFILSTRSGGLGLNLTGADTVIFYDQDWNPAMDKQCQDRCHRIGQTRDVHIYRLISEHTIEANILRKASQKQMLDDVVIQEGEFTTEYFNNSKQVTVQDVAGRLMGENDDAANAAMDLVLGGVETSDSRTATKVLEQAEDTEDVVAARAAEKEFQQDDADFSENRAGSGSGTASVAQGTSREGSVSGPPGGGPGSGPGRSGLGLFAESAADTPAADEQAPEAEPEFNAWGGRVHNIDEFMLATMACMLEGTPLDLPKDKKKGKKKGRDTRKR